MPRARKGAVQIRFEILEYLYFNSHPQPRTHIWRRATTLSYDDFMKHLARAVLAEEEFRESESTVNQHFPKLPIKFRLLAYILKKGEPTEIDGQIVALEGKILVISNGESLLNINMPRKWITEGVTYGVHDLLEGDPIGPGDSISINTLKVEIDKDTHSETCTAPTPSP